MPYHAQLDISLFIYTQRKFRSKNLTGLQNVDEPLGKYETGLTVFPRSYSIMNLIFLTFSFTSEEPLGL